MWARVREIIIDVFRDTDIEILKRRGGVEMLQIDVSALSGVNIPPDVLAKTLKTIDDGLKVEVKENSIIIYGLSNNDRYSARVIRMAINKAIHYMNRY